MTCKGRLRNIQFEYVRVRILSIEYITRVLVEWRLAETSQRLNNLKFYVDRSESGNEWTTIDGPIEHDALYEFIDYTAQLYDMQKTYYYRVRAVELDSMGEEAQTFTSMLGNTAESPPDLVSVYVIEEHLFKMRYVDGVPVFIYKKRHDGGRCPDCWDAVLKRVTKGNCTTCYGTGRVDGYYPPIEAWMNFDVHTEVANVGQQGLVQPDHVTGTFTDYPLLRIDDLIKEVRSGYFWKISSLTMPEKNRTVLLQQFQLKGVNRADVEYLLTYPEDKARAMIEEFEARLQKPEF